MSDSGEFLRGLFSLEGRVAVVTGGTGVLGGVVARGLREAGAHVVVLGRSTAKVEAITAGGDARFVAMPCEVRDAASVEAARDAVLEQFGAVDILINMAGGNMPAATATPDRGFFGLEDEALREVLDLNVMGTLIPTRIFGQSLVESRFGGSVVNVSSASAPRAMTRVVGYAAAKAAIENFTKWSATELARQFGDGIRVNAIAPGFYIGEQNRALLLEPDGSLTPRGQTVIDHTPAGRFGAPEELVGTVIWLCSPAAAFVNGAIIPIDGGFAAFSGV